MFARLINKKLQAADREASECQRARFMREFFLGRGCSYLGGHTQSGCVKLSRTYTALQTCGKKVQRVRRGRVEQRSLAYLLDGALGQEVGLLMVRIVMVLGWLRVRLQQRERFGINFLRKTPQFASLARTPPSERLEIDVFRVEVDDSRPNDFSYHPRLCKLAF